MPGRPKPATANAANVSGKPTARCPHAAHRHTPYGLCPHSGHAPVRPDGFHAPRHRSRTTSAYRTSRRTSCRRPQLRVADIDVLESVSAGDLAARSSVSTGVGGRSSAETRKKTRKVQGHLVARLRANQSASRPNSSSESLASEPPSWSLRHARPFPASLDRAQHRLQRGRANVAVEGSLIALMSTFAASPSGTAAPGAPRRCTRP
jgi:hypothetical protein